MGLRLAGSDNNGPGNLFEAFLDNPNLMLPCGYIVQGQGGLSLVGPIKKDVCAWLGVDAKLAEAGRSLDFCLEGVIHVRFFSHWLKS